MSDQRELGNYFVEPAELLQERPYKWIPKDVRSGMKPLEVEFTE